MIFSFQIEDNISLALPQLSLAQNLFDLIDRNREHLSKWLGWVDGTRTVEDSKSYLTDSLKAYAEGKRLPLVILYKGHVAGCIGFIMIDQKNGKAEIGYWLGKEFTGKGIMTKCVKYLIAYGFEKLELNKILIRAATENSASNNVAKRLGFRLEGVLRDDVQLNGVFYDGAVYGLLRQDLANWRK